MDSDTAAHADPIRHVVVLGLENHSFDQMLGCFKQLYPDLEGVDPAAPRANSDDEFHPYAQSPTTERQMLLDPRHEVAHVAVQLAGGNSGFVKDFARAFPQSTMRDRQFIMGYYPLDFLPALHALAREFTICDHWFSSVPGPTWPNRFFMATGTSLGRVNMPGDGDHTVDPKGWFEQDQDTIFDRLTERGIHWKVYFHDIPQTSVLRHQRLPHNAARYFYIDEFFADARGAEEEFPEFCLIEPDFMGSNENDDHPPHDIMKAEKLIAEIYNAIRANPELWRSTLLVVFFDEHGGFYDHVTPPPAVPPDDHREEYTFDRLGVRVPALLVSPWVGKRVETTQFDHTSVLKYLIDKWRLAPLGERAAQAASIGAALTQRTPREDTLPRIELTRDQLAPPDPELEEKATAMDSDHHKALRAMAGELEIRVIENLPRAYSWGARCIEAVKAWCERGLARLYHEGNALPVSLTEPDKLARKTVAVREDYARFLMHQKRRALPCLAERIRDEGLPLAAREHAVHTLALISGRRFHREKDKLAHADKWLRRHGH